MKTLKLLTGALLGVALVACSTYSSGYSNQDIPRWKGWLYSSYAPHR